jgi:hypothetical protein
MMPGILGSVCYIYFDIDAVILGCPQSDNLKDVQTMTSAKQIPGMCNGMDPASRLFVPIAGGSEQEKSDRQANHQYVPMDIYLDKKTIQEHFLISSIRKR